MYYSLQQIVQVILADEEVDQRQLNLEICRKRMKGMTTTTFDQTHSKQATICSQNFFKYWAKSYQQILKKFRNSDNFFLCIVTIWIPNTWIPDLFEYKTVWVSGIQMIDMWLGRPFEYQTFWTINRLFHSNSQLFRIGYSNGWTIQIPDCGPV